MAVGEESKPQTGRKYFQKIVLIKIYYLKQKEFLAGHSDTYL